MASAVDVANLALSHLGISDEIAAFDEQSEEAATANRFYEQARDEVLRDFDWPFARRIATLTLLETDPTDEWGYSYVYPADVLAIRRLPSGSGIRTTTALSRIKYSIGGDAAGRLIYTDQPDATVTYTERVTDPGRFPPDFVQALACKLAFYMAPRLTGGDEYKLGARAAQMYQYAIAVAQANAANEAGPDIPAEAEMVTARESA